MATSERRPSGRAGTEPRLALRQVIDHALLDVDGRRAGRVDDLRLAVEETAAGPRLVLTTIVSGPLPRPTRPTIARIARLGYRLLGIRDPAPATLPWSVVDAIDVFVHTTVQREAAGLQPVDLALRRRFDRHRERREG